MVRGGLIACPIAVQIPSAWAATLGATGIARSSSAGCQPEVVDSQRALNYVLLHGEDHLGSRWTPEWLDAVEAAAFPEFLENQFTVQDGYEIFRELRRRAQV